MSPSSLRTASAIFFCSFKPSTISIQDSSDNALDWSLGLENVLSLHYMFFSWKLLPRCQIICGLSYWSTYSFLSTCSCSYSLKNFFASIRDGIEYNSDQHFHWESCNSLQQRFCHINLLIISNIVKYDQINFFSWKRKASNVGKLQTSTFGVLFLQFFRFYLKFAECIELLYEYYWQLQFSLNFPCFG